MTPKEFFEKHTREEVARVAEAAGTNIDNFRQIALYGGKVGSRLARRLEEASNGKMSLREILFPDEF